MKGDMENQENSEEKELLIWELQASKIKEQNTSQVTVNMLYLKGKAKITHQHTLLHSALKILGLQMISQAGITWAEMMDIPHPLLIIHLIVQATEMKIYSLMTSMGIQAIHQAIHMKVVIVSSEVMEKLENQDLILDLEKEKENIRKVVHKDHLEPMKL
jgi:hypothetical protein